MAQLDAKLNEGQMLQRVLAYGPAKCKKTWWAARAAEAGFNVLLLDGDDGWHILKNIAPEAQKRIQVVDLVDDGSRPVFSIAMTQLLKERRLIWDEKEKRSAKLSPNENCILIDLAKFDHTSVIIVDSWTALSFSLLQQYAKENSIDLAEAEKSDWDFYRWGGTLATWIQQQLKTLPCHVIVVGHGSVYEKRAKDGKKIEWQRTQPLSTSGPNAMQMAKNFSDILYFYVKGSAFKIDVSGGDDKDGGSRVIPPATYSWDELQFANLCLAGGGALPSPDLPLIDYSLADTPAQKPSGGLIQKSSGVLNMKS